MFRYSRPPRPADQRGFTVLELLVAILLAGALIGLSFWLAHPKDYSPTDHNAARWTDVSQLMQVVKRYHTDTGTLPASLPTDAKQIGDGDNMIDLCPVFVPKYMKDVPLDPVDGGQYAIGDCRGSADSPGKYVTGYTIKKTADNTVTITAPSAEHGKKIHLTYKF